MTAINKHFFFLLLGLFFATATRAQSDDYRKVIKDIMSQSEEVVDEIIEAGLEVVRLEYDLVRDSKNSFRVLSPNYTYGIIAFGDVNRFADVDLVVYKSDGEGGWIKVGADTDKTNEAVVKVEPDESAEYRFEVKAEKFLEGNDVGNYCLIICNKEKE